jgi:tetratricopeptide (TPR) repeat protein
VTAEADVAAAVRLHTRGRLVGNQGRHRDAERLCRSALRLLADLAPSEEVARALVRVLNTLAYVEFQLYGLDVARARLDEADAVLDEHGLTDLQTALRSQRGALLLRSGDQLAAIEEFDRGLRLAATAPASDRCAVLQNRAVAHMEAGNHAAARADLAACVAAASAEGLTLIEVMATHNLGFLDFLSGDLPSALRLMDRAFETDPTVSPGTAKLGKAQVLVEAGLYRDADDTLVEACRILRSGRVSFDLAEAELERARCALAVDDPARARRLAAASRDRFRRAGNHRWQRSAEVVVLQAEVAARRRSFRAATPARRLMDELRTEGLRLPARIAGLIAAEAHLSGGQVDEAAALLGELGQPRRDDPITGRMHSHYVQARVDAASLRPAAAARRVRRGLDELARYQATFGSIDLRTAAAVHGRRLAELDITLALDGGRPGPVFAAVERARAVSSRLPPVRPPDDPVAADRLAELRQTLEALRAVELDPSASEPLLRKRRQLERAIVARSWTVSGSGAVDRPASLDAVRARLAERGRSMVTYIQAAGRLSAVVVSTRTSVLDLGAAGPVVEQVRRVRADLDVLAHPGLPAGIRAAVRASLDTSLRVLDETLLGPIGLDGALVLVSTGVLGQLPWASLPTLRGRSIVVAASATKWLSSTAADASAATVAALAGPDLDRGTDETTSVGAVWPGADVRDAEDATAAALTNAMMTADILHVAAHGVHQPENPLFSSVRMVDGPVFAHELDRFGRAPSHVVLSACEVGLATIRPGDEALGLASVLLHLGTRSVIAGVARVGDAVAADTMATYHRKLAAGADSSTALAEALVEADTDVTPPFVNFGAAWAANLDTVSPVA